MTDSKAWKDRVIGIFLSVVLIVGLMPARALAQEAQETQEAQPTQEAQETQEPASPEQSPAGQAEETPSPEGTQSVEEVTVSHSAAYQVPELIDPAHPEKGMTWGTERSPEDSIAMTADTVSWSDGQWIVAEGSVKASAIEVAGTVNLILADGAALEVEGGIHVGAGAALNVYGQEQGTGTLTVTGSASAAAIGSKSGEENGKIAIYGGAIYAQGGDLAAAIGSGKQAAAKDISIYGGTISATGGSKGAGIGCGYKGSAQGICIYGGTISITGTQEAAAIGGSYESTVDGISIYGGTVNVTGGSDAAAIGGGKESTVSNISIGGGTVTATGGSKGAGIGSGWKGQVDGITISGGIVDATGGIEAAGIGGSYKTTVSNITVSGGATTATAGEYAAAIGGGKEGTVTGIQFTGGVVNAICDESGDSSIGAGKGGKCSGIIVQYPEDIDVKVWNTSTRKVIATNGDITSLMGNFNIAISNGTISAKGITTTFANKCPIISSEQYYYMASRINVVASGGLELLESQAQFAAYILGCSDAEMIEILADPNKTIDLSLEFKVTLIKFDSPDGWDLHMDFALEAVGTCVLHDGETSTTVSKTVNPEAFSMARGKLIVTLPIPLDFIPYIVLHTSDDGKEVYDLFEGKHSSWVEDSAAGTYTITISHCSHIQTSFNKQEAGSIPETGDNLAGLLPVVASAIIAALAFAIVSRRRVRS